MSHDTTGTPLTSGQTSDTSSTFTLIEEFSGSEISSLTVGEQQFTRVPNNNPQPYNLQLGTYLGRSAVRIEARPGDKNTGDASTSNRVGLDGFVKIFDGIQRVLHTRFEVTPDPLLTPPLAQAAGDWWAIFEEHGIVMSSDGGVGGAFSIGNEWKGGAAKTCVVHKVPNFNATTGFLNGTYSLDYLSERAVAPWGVWEVWAHESSADESNGSLIVQHNGVTVVDYAGPLGFSTMIGSLKERSRSYRQIRAYENEKGYPNGFIVYTDNMVCDSTPFNPTAGVSPVENWTPADLGSQVLYAGPASGLDALNLSASDETMGVFCTATLGMGAGDFDLFVSSANGGYGLKARNIESTQAVMTFVTRPSTARAAASTTGLPEMRPAAGIKTIFGCVGTYGATSTLASSPRGSFNVNGQWMDADRNVTTLFTDSLLLRKGPALATDDLVVVTTGALSRLNHQRIVGWIAAEAGMMSTLVDGFMFKAERPKKPIIFDDDAAALFSRMTTQPSTAFKVAISDFVAGLKADGVWPLIDEIYIPRALGANDFHRAVKNAAYDLVRRGSAGVTGFNPTKGLKVAGGAYWGTNWNPTTVSSPKFALNSAFMLRWIEEDLGVISSEYCGNANSNISRAGGAPAGAGAKGKANFPGVGGAFEFSSSGFNIGGIGWRRHTDTIAVNGGYQWRRGAAGSNAMSDPGTPASALTNAEFEIGRAGATPCDQASFGLVCWGQGVTQAQMQAIFDRYDALRTTIAPMELFSGSEISSLTVGEQQFTRVPNNNPQPYNLQLGAYLGRSAVRIEARPGDKNTGDASTSNRAGLDGFIKTFDSILTKLYSKFEVAPDPLLVSPIAQATGDWWTIYENHGIIFSGDGGVGGTMQITNEWKGGVAKTCVVRKVAGFNATTGLMDGTYSLDYLYESPSTPWGVWEVMIHESGADAPGSILIKRDGVTVVNFTGQVGFMSNGSTGGLKERSKSYRQIRAYENEKGYPNGFIVYTDNMVCDSTPFNPTAGVSPVENWTPADLGAQVLYAGPASGLDALNLSASDETMGVFCTATLGTGAGDFDLFVSSANGGYGLKARNIESTQSVMTFVTRPSTARAAASTTGLPEMRPAAGVKTIFGCVGTYGATSTLASSPRGSFNVNGQWMDADRNVTTLFTDSLLLRKGPALATDDLVVVTTGALSRLNHQRIVGWIAAEAGMMSTLVDGFMFKAERPKKLII